MDLVLKAIRFAQEKHKGQTRKVSGLEYFTHPLGVSYLVTKYKISKYMQTLQCAAILHDTVEDTLTTFEEILKEFNMATASLVYEVTDDKVESKRIGKLEYSKKRWIGYSTYGLYLRLCDRLYNLSDNPTKEMIEITSALLDFIEKNRKLTRSHKAVIIEIRKVINDYNNSVS